MGTASSSISLNMDNNGTEPINNNENTKLGIQNHQLEFTRVCMCTPHYNEVSVNRNTATETQTLKYAQ